MTIGERIAMVRYQRGISLKVLSKTTGLTLGALSNIESGYVEPSRETVELVCRGLDFGMDELMREDMMLAHRGAMQIPVYGSMKDLMVPSSMMKPQGSVYVSNMLMDKGEHFIVKVEESAMDASRIHADDYILVRRQVYIRDYEIAVVQINEQAPIVRSVVYRGEDTILFAKNFSGMYSPIVVQPMDLFRIIGRVVRVIANLRQYSACIKLMQNEDTPLSDRMLEQYGIYRPVSVFDFQFNTQQG